LYIINCNFGKILFNLFNGLFMSDVAIKPSICFHPPPRPVIQTGLLIAAVGAGIISVIPALSLIGTLSLRSVGLIFNCFNILDKHGNNDYQVIAFKAIKIALAVLSIVAVAIALPLIIVAYLSIDIALQTFDLVRALYNKQYKKALFHFSLIAIDSLVISGLVAGSWPCLIAASAVSAAAMGTIAYYIARKAKTTTETINLACYLALSLIGVAGALTTAETSHKFAINSQVTEPTAHQPREADTAGQMVRSVEEDSKKQTEPQSS
jgi:hypothetical protein